jgi:excinuclease ABC subunit A
VRRPGRKLAFDADLIVPDKDKTAQGRDPALGQGPPLYTQTLQALARHCDFSMDEPF